MRRAWARASGLARPETDRPGPAAVVAAAAGIQAQDRRAARLSVWARARSLEASAIEDALVGDRSVVRTWAMRGTLHLVAAEDVRWLLDLLGPVFVAATGRRCRDMGLDEETCCAAVAAIGRAVATESPLTRAALAERIRASGIDVEPGSQAVAHLVRRAALEGVICCGPDDGTSETYVGLSDWLSGWVLAGTDLGRGDVGSPCVRLLPAFDTYLLGHRGRELIVDDHFSRKVWPGGGWIHPTVVVDGKVVGTWEIERGRRSTRPRNPNAMAVAVTPSLFTDLDGEVVGLLHAETGRLRAFLAAS